MFSPPFTAACLKFEVYTTLKNPSSLLQGHKNYVANGIGGASQVDIGMPMNFFINHVQGFLYVLLEKINLSFKLKKLCRLSRILAKTKNYVFFSQ
jgi:hypothetical protein